MKTDVEEAGPVPKKRKHLESALDLHIAQWLASDDLTPSERRRVGEEKARRKALIPDVSLGIIVGDEGVTPEQLASIRQLMDGARATEIHHGGVSSKLHTACRSLDVPVVREPQVTGQDRDKSIVRASTVLICATKETYTPTSKAGVWATVKYAKHRGVPVWIVMPDGQINEGSTLA